MRNEKNWRQRTYFARKRGEGEGEGGERRPTKAGGGQRVVGTGGQVGEWEKIGKKGQAG